MLNDELERAYRDGYSQAMVDVADALRDAGQPRHETDHLWDLFLDRKNVNYKQHEDEMSRRLKENQ